METMQTQIIGVYIISAIMIICSIIGLIGLIRGFIIDTKRNMLDYMFQNNDISSSIYKKYKKEL